MKTKVSRRRALELGASTLLPVLGTQACGDDTSETVTPGSIEHIVVLMMENRSYDHILGSRKLDGLPGDGLEPSMSNVDAEGTEHAVYRASLLCVADPPHGWDSSHAQFNTGKNDGFLTEYQLSQGEDVEPSVMSYFTKEDLPVTHALADSYTSCDRWFCSVMGPTWPNRFYFHSAQSVGLKSNDSPAERWPTIYDRMDEAGVSWEYFYTDLPFLLILGLSKTSPATPNFFDAAKNGTLPSVTVIDPGFALNDDHPPHHPLLGQQMIAAVYQALATSPLWEKTLLVVTYDEHGGFFDHVSPPKAADDRAAEGFDQLGFRVPTLVIGPWVKEGHVSSVVYDHTSILKHIETLFDLEPLTARDAAANDLSDAIDAERLAKNQPSAPIQLPTVDIDASEIDPECKSDIPRSGKYAGPLPSPKSDIEIWADAGNVPAHLDLRSKNRETAFFIGDYLASHGIGSIKR